MTLKQAKLQKSLPNDIKNKYEIYYQKLGTLAKLFFFPLLEVEDIELSKEAKALGFPIIHKHKLCCLRQELIDAFVESRYMMFIKYAAVQLQQLGLKKQMDIFQKKPEQPAIKDDKSDDSPAEGKT